MSYRVMALVTASLLFATQCYAEAVKGSKSNNFRQGSATSGGGAGKTTDASRMGGGGGKGAMKLNPQPEPPGSKAK
jgi:hypothetical protein